MSTTWNKLVNDVIDELKEKSQEEFTDVSDLIHEIADSNVPIYTHDLLQLASDNFRLATVEPEL